MSKKRSKNDNDWKDMIQIGQGAYGFVYLAHDPKTNEAVALKKVFF